MVVFVRFVLVLSVVASLCCCGGFVGAAVAAAVAIVSPVISFSGCVVECVFVFYSMFWLGA